MPAYTTEQNEPGGRREVVTSVAFLLLAVVVLYLPAEAQQQVASALRSTVLRPFVMTQEGLAQARARATETEELRHRLDSLVSVVAARSTLDEENRRLRGLLSLSRRVGPGYRASVVVRPGTAGSESTFLVDVGSEEGVRAPAAVITREGLLGRVRDVREHSAIGMDWTHPDFRASAMTLDGTTSGIVESHRGDFREEDRLVLNGTAFHTTLDEGTVVVTSGLGGVYPRGIPIGRVRALAEADAGWRKSYWLEPFVDPAVARQVLVAVGGADTLVTDLSGAWPEDSITTVEEIASLERTRRESLAAVEDSLEILRAILAARRQQDSVRAAVRSDSASPITRPAPPTPTSAGSTGAASGGRTPEARGAPPTVATPPPDTSATQPDTSGLRPDTSGLRPDTSGVRPDTSGVRAPAGIGGVGE